MEENLDSDHDDDHEELDPRVQTELEKLNARTEEINALELQLEDANGLFRTLLTDSTAQLKSLSKRLGSCIEKARPYYVALQSSQRAQKECQSAATHYQRASGVHTAAKETITLAEERFLSNCNDWKFDNAWQEMLNHATIKVMEAEKVKTDSEAEHLKRADLYQAAEAEVHRLEKKLHKFISKSAPYFEQKDIFNNSLESQKARVQELQAKIIVCKKQYAQSLRNLEVISESIHAQRKLRMMARRPTREPGVGAELASLPSFDLDSACCLDDGSSIGGSSLSSAPLSKSGDGDGMSQRAIDEEQLEMEAAAAAELRKLSLASEGLPSIEPVPSPPSSPAASRFSLKTITRSLSVPTQMLFKQSSMVAAAAEAGEVLDEEDSSVQNGLEGTGVEL